MLEINTNDSSIDQVLSDDLYSGLKVILKSYDLDIKNFEGFEPWILDLM